MPVDEPVSSESVIVGQWIKGDDGSIRGDEKTDFIQSFIASRLRFVAARDGGWTTLFYDPDNDEYWERTFPDGHMHGGGPPALARLSKAEVLNLYPPKDEPA